MNCIIVEQGEACFQKLGFYFVDLGLIAGFQLQLKVAAGDGHVDIAAVVLYADNIGTAIADDFADLTQLARTIIKHDNKVSLATGGDLTTSDDARKNININVAAGN